MKIEETIRERRLAKHLTQEQLANYLGVTAPAVNKWEKGISYPDIRLLPALARLLDTDLNTLLSFQDDLTEQEVALFLNQVSQTIRQQNFAAGYAMAMEKLKEFPTCDLLVLGLAMVLDGARTMLHLQDDQSEAYEAEILSLYRRAAASSQQSVRDQAIAQLISKSLQSKDDAGAQALLDTVADRSPVEKNALQTTIWMAQGNLQAAAKQAETTILLAYGKAHTAVMTLLEIAIRENRWEDAAYLAEVDQKAAKAFDLTEYNQYLAYFRLYMAKKDREQCIKALLPMLRSLERKPNLCRSPLYGHIQSKETESWIGTELRQRLLRSILKDPDAAFLRDSPELQEFLEPL